tara:strand:+ start:984 stop:1439 length:456 start_codon:yes stop_codon:yes gene_type:complete
MKLSANFTVDELCKSETASRKNIENVPSEKVISNLLSLTKMILQPVRSKLGIVIVTSGYRSPALNRSIGGAASSDHCTGCAADFEVVGMDNKELAIWIRDSLTFKQLILEFYENSNPHSGWVHCSFEEGSNKKEVLTAYKDGKATKYKQGL